MKSLKSKVILSAVVLIFALVATIGSTFAWFTVSSTVTASSLTLNVSTEKSLLIKVANLNETYTSPKDYDPLNYTTALTSTDFTGDLGYYLNSWVLRPSTAVDPGYNTAYVNTFASIEQTSGNLTNLLAAGINNASTGYVVQLKFWVMAQSAANLYVGSVNVAGGTGIGGDNTPASVITAIEGSTRLSFVSDYTESTVTNKGYIFGNDGSIDYTYQFPGGGHTLITASAVQSPVGTIDDTADLATLVGTTGTSGSVIEVLAANVPELVNVYIFIEGWDSQANNTIIGAPFRVSFGFIIN